MISFQRYKQINKVTYVLKQYHMIQITKLINYFYKSQKAMSSEDSYQERFMRFLNQMHFDSQPVAEKLYKTIILTVAILSYIIAFFLQRFSICIYSVLVATVVCVIVTVPGGWKWWQKPLPAFAKAKSN